MTFTDYIQYPVPKLVFFYYFLLHLRSWNRFNSFLNRIQDRRCTGESTAMLIHFGVFVYLYYYKI